MTAAGHVGAMSYAEYLAFERDAECKHEYVNGQVYALAGGSTEHARLTARLIHQLGQALAGRPCEVFSSDLRVRNLQTGRSSYPDVTVVCGRIDRAPDEDPTRHGDEIPGPARRALVLPATNIALGAGRQRLVRGSMVEIGAVELERVLVDAIELTPGAVLIDHPDWVQLTTPSLPHASRNGVFLARLTPEAADARIAEVKRLHVERGAGIRWIVGPSCTPDDLSARLERAGVPVLASALGMHMVVPASVADLPVGLDLRPVGVHEVGDYGDINAQAWERGPAFGRESESFVTRALERGDETLRSWLVYWDQQLIGTATLCLLPGLGYLQGAAILREHRRRGIYQALLDYRLGVLRGLGVEHVVVWADESTSAGVCRRAGFVPKCRAVFHELPEPPLTADSA